MKEETESFERITPKVKTEPKASETAQLASAKGRGVVSNSKVGLTFLRIISRGRGCDFGARITQLVGGREDRFNYWIDGMIWSCSKEPWRRSTFQNIKNVF